MATLRLDAALMERGLARSRTAAAKLIADGLVTVNGIGVVKAATKVGDGDALAVSGGDHYVSRGAHKLIAALDAFAVEPSGRLALDIGASTGGFTQVLLERGAARVIALDVGHGQLAPQIRGDERVSVVEGFNVRDLTSERLAAASGVSDLPTLVVGDLSFISLGYVLGPVAETAHDADIVLLIKPQFEVGRTGVKEGVVRDAGLRVDAVSNVLWKAWDAGLGTAGFIASPIIGSHGNHEYLVHLHATRGGNPTEWLTQVNQVAGA